MQIRPYPEKDGKRIWLNRSERARLLEVVQDDPRRQLAIQLGLHGLRTDEIVDVTPGDVRELGPDAAGLVVRDGKSGRRQLPISSDLEQRIRYFKSAAQLRQDEPVVDVGRRQVRNWLEDARDEVAASSDRPEDWLAVTMHDLRRSWATDGYYSLAFAGVPIAEQLIMSFGGWAQSESGRDTFRRHYLGPVPDEIAALALEDLALS